MRGCPRSCHACVWFPDPRSCHASVWFPDPPVVLPVCLCACIRGFSCDPLTDQDRIVFDYIDTFVGRDNVTYVRRRTRLHGRFFTPLHFQDYPFDSQRLFTFMEVQNDNIQNVFSYKIGARQPRNSMPRTVTGWANPLGQPKAQSSPDVQSDIVSH